MIPVGSSAALAAAFNTPIAAVLFSLEEILGDSCAGARLRSLSSATSWIVLHLILGDEPLFHVPAYQLVNPAECLIYAVLGVVGGLGSVFFVKLLLWIGAGSASSRITDWIQPVAGGLTVGMSRIVGAGSAGRRLRLCRTRARRRHGAEGVAMLVVLKIVATATCYSSGNAGGIFGPSLFIGAMIGGERWKRSLMPVSHGGRRIPGRTRLSEWERHSQASCARR